MLDEGENMAKFIVGEYFKNEALIYEDWVTLSDPPITYTEM